MSLPATQVSVIHRCIACGSDKGQPNTCRAALPNRGGVMGAKHQGARSANLFLSTTRKGSLKSSTTLQFRFLQISVPSGLGHAGSPHRIHELAREMAGRALVPACLRG